MRFAPVIGAPGDSFWGLVGWDHKGAVESDECFSAAYASEETRYLFALLPGRYIVREQRMERFTRITRDPNVMGGKACIRGMRVTVGMILGQIGAGATEAELLNEYPYLETEDIKEAIRYGAWLAQEGEVEFQPA
jgi:uncharacterized protein (DUF433 family)